MSMSGRLIRRCLSMTSALRRAQSPTMFQHMAVVNQAVIPRTLCANFHMSAKRFGESSNVINIQSEQDFKERVLQNELPVVLDFHATWCGPCKMLGPRLESLVGSKKDKLILAKVDIDELSEIAIDHGVEAVPTVLAMKGGKEVERFVGLQDDDQLETFVEKLTG